MEAVFVLTFRLRFYRTILKLKKKDGVLFYKYRFNMTLYCLVVTMETQMAH